MSQQVADPEAPPARPVIRPFGDRILLRPVPAPDETPSGLLIPDMAKPRPDRGVVIAVGPGSYYQGHLEPIEGLRPGDRVIYIRHGGYVVELPIGEYGEELLLVTPREIVAVEGPANLQVAAEPDWCGNCSAPVQMCMAGVLCCDGCTHEGSPVST